MTAPTKMVARPLITSEGSGVKGAVGPPMQKYKDMGLIKDLTEQLKLLADDSP